MQKLEKKDFEKQCVQLREELAHFFDTLDDGSKRTCRD